MKVLDSSAILAILYAEDGAAAAESALADGLISLVNVAEVVGDFVRAGRDAGEAASALADLGLAWVEPDTEQALCAAQLRAIEGLSLGDRFCIALALSRSAPVVTADQAWANHALGVPVELIR